MDQVSRDPLEWVQYPSLYYDYFKQPGTIFDIPLWEVDWSYSNPFTAQWCATYSEYEWEVYLENSAARVRLKKREIRRNKYRDINYVFDDTESPELPLIDISEYDIPRTGTRHIVKVTDGWLVAYNAGRYKHNLWWHSDDGSEGYKLSDDFIDMFFTWNNELYALGSTRVGIALLWGDGFSEEFADKYGSKIYKIAKDPEDKWTREVVASAYETPATVCTYDGKLYLVTLGFLLIEISPDYNVVNIIRYGFWYNLFPNSIVIDKQGNIFIGMRQGVAMSNLDDPEKELRWLVPSEQYVKQEMKHFRKHLGTGCDYIDFILPRVQFAIQSSIQAIRYRIHLLWRRMIG